MGKLMGIEQLFEGRHFDREVIILCVRWYLRFKLSLRDLVEMMAEREACRWPIRPLCVGCGDTHRSSRSAGSGSPRRSAGHGGWTRHTSNIRGEWCYLYRAVDRAGRLVDFRLSAKRDVAAAKAFFRKAIKGQHDAPRTITLDGYAAPHRAVRELKADGLLPAETKLRSSKYLNNLIEQDHRGREPANRHDAGLQGLLMTAAIPIAGIELMHRIRKETIRIGTSGCQRSTCARSVECRAPSLKSRQHNTGRFPAPVICTEPQKGLPV